IIVFSLSSRWGYIIANVFKYAHKPDRKFNALLAQSKNNIPINLKYKILVQIERLALTNKRPIAIYCLDIFPFTHKQFFNFIMGWANSYFLLLSFLNYINLGEYE